MPVLTAKTGAQTLSLHTTLASVGKPTLGEGKLDYVLDCEMKINDSDNSTVLDLDLKIQTMIELKVS
jgi:hypothetical protein